MMMYSIASAIRSREPDIRTAPINVEAENLIKIKITGNTRGKPRIESRVILLPALDEIADSKVKIALRFNAPITRQSKYLSGYKTGKPNNKEYKKTEQSVKTTMITELKISFEINIA